MTQTAWKIAAAEGVFLALILFLVTYPLYSILNDNQLWPGPGQNSPEISAYQLSHFAHDAAMVVVVLVFVGYVLIRRTQPVLATTYTLLFGYALFCLARYASGGYGAKYEAYGGVQTGLAFSWAYVGEIAGGILTLIVLAVSNALNPGVAQATESKKKKN